MYLCLAAPCLSRCPWAFCHVEGGGYSPVALHGLLLQRLLLLWARASGVLASGFQHTGSVVTVHGLSCSTARGILPGIKPVSPALARAFFPTGLQL